MKNNPVSKMDFVADEIEYVSETAESDGERDPKIDALLEKANKAVAQLDPIVRETMRDNPEALAKWDSIMRDHAAAVAEDEAAKARQAAKEAEAAKLDEEIRVALDRINADIDQLEAMSGPDLEFEAAAEQTFAAIHELDAVIRLRCRDFPEQMERWKETMEGFADIEAIFERGRAREDSEPAN